MPKPVTPEEFLERVARLGTHRHRGRRAPHKPLLLLFALGRVLRRRDRLVRYTDLEQQVGQLIGGFGSPQNRARPQYPFRWLLTDALWEIPRFSELSKNKSGDLSVRQLRELDVRGGLPREVYDLLLSNPWLARQAAGEILREHFPESLHGELLEAADIPGDGIAWEAATGAEGATGDAAGATVWERERGAGPEDPKPPTFYWFQGHRRRRDPLFRRKVLEAYDERCSVCDLDIRLGDRLLGLEAAHIQWHSHGGPDQIANGLALCLLHHKALDRGALGLEERKGTGFSVLISRQVRGEKTGSLVDFAGHRIRPPRNPLMTPATDFVLWHRTEVFRGG